MSHEVSMDDAVRGAAAAAVLDGSIEEGAETAVERPGASDARSASCSWREVGQGETRTNYCCMRDNCCSWLRQCCADWRKRDERGTNRMGEDAAKKGDIVEEAVHVVLVQSFLRAGRRRGGWEPGIQGEDGGRREREEGEGEREREREEGEGEGEREREREREMMMKKGRRGGYG